MAATQIKEMRPTHDAVLDHVLTRPHATLSELSRVTGYTVSWLSQMIRSDAFKAAYAARRGEIECTVMEGIGDRLNGLAHLAIDKLEEELTKTKDPDMVLDSFDKVLHRAGYAPAANKAPAGPVLQQNNVFLVSRDDLNTAREKILNPLNVVPAALLPSPAPDASG